MKVEKLESVKIKDAFYFPKPGSQYKALPVPSVCGGAEYSGAWTWNGISIIAGVAKYNGVQWLHVSFARKSRMPTYAEMKMIKRDFIGEDKKAIFVLPKKENYVNIHPNCLHLWTCENDILPDFDCGLGTI